MAVCGRSVARGLGRYAMVELWITNGTGAVTCGVGLVVDDVGNPNTRVAGEACLSLAGFGRGRARSPNPHPRRLDDHYTSLEAAEIRSGHKFPDEPVDREWTEGSGPKKDNAWMSPRWVLPQVAKLHARRAPGRGQRDSCTTPSHPAPWPQSWGPWRAERFPLGGIATGGLAKPGAPSCGTNPSAGPRCEYSNA
jgi:hypothetical protein